MQFNNLSETNPYLLPVTGEKIEAHGLAGVTQHIGTFGKVLK
jgi:hypothetical protein